MRYQLIHKPLWRHGGRIEPGTLIQPTPAELRAFPDRLQPVPEATGPPAGPYRLSERPGGWYDVVDGAGRPVTPKALRREAAESLLAELTQ